MSPTPKTADYEIAQLTATVLALTDNIKQLQTKITQSEKILIFLDNSNFFGSIARLSRELNYQFRVDYSKLRNLLTAGRFNINSLCYYSEWEGDTEKQNKNKNFHIMMERSGYSMITFRQKPGREKGVDASIVTDMITCARDMPRCDTFVLVSGDGDYSETIWQMKINYGIKVEIAFFGRETSLALKDNCSKFIDLEDRKHEFQLLDNFSRE